MFRKWLEKQKIRKDKIQKAREGFVSWLEISKSPGWKIYDDRIEKEIENIKTQLANDTSLTPEDLKRLQLALQVWKKVKRIPSDLEKIAMGGK